jgi:hypothetical protein
MITITQPKTAYRGFARTACFAGVRATPIA